MGKLTFRHVRPSAKGTKRVFGTSTGSVSFISVLLGLCNGDDPLLPFSLFPAALKEDTTTSECHSLSLSLYILGKMYTSTYRLSARPVLLVRRRRRRRVYVTDLESSSSIALKESQTRAYL